MQIKQGVTPSPSNVGILYKAEVGSAFGWSMLGHYETVATFATLYGQLIETSSEEELALDIHKYFDEETGFSYRLRPMTFLREG